MAEEVLVATVRAELNQFRTQMQDMARVTERASRDSVVATGRLNTSLQQTQRELRQTGTAAQSAATGLAGFAKSGLAIAGGLGIVTSLTAIVAGLKTLVGSSITAANQFAAFAIGLKNATGSMVGAQQAMGFVRAEANRLGIDITTAAQRFTSLANATKNTGLEGTATRTIFSALSEASRALGLNTEQYGRALLAVSQIAAKGRIQQEELLQLAEAGIPVYAALSKELGITTGELTKMIEKGDLTADALLRLANGLRKEVGGAATEAADKFFAAATRMGNASTEFLASLGRIITESPAIRGAIDGITASIQTLRNAVENMRRAGLPGAVGRNAQLAEILATTDIRVEELSLAQQARLLQRDPNAPAGETDAARLEDIRKQVEAQRQRISEASQTATQLFRAGPNIGLEVTPKEAEERIRQLRRKIGITAEEEQQDFHAQLQREEEARKKAQAEGLRAAAEGKRIAEERHRHAIDLQQKTIALNEDQFQAERDQLTLTVQEFRREKRSETEIAAFESQAKQDILRREVEAGMKTLDEQQKGKEEVEKAQTAIVTKESAERLKFTNALAALETKATKTRIDDLRERLDQERAMFAEQGRTQEELEEHAAASHAFLQREQTEETAKELKEQSREYEQFAKRVQDTTGQFIFDALSGRIQSFKDLLGSIKDFFLRVLSDMLAAAIARPIIIPIVTAFTGALGLNELFGLTAGLVGTAGAGGAGAGAAGGGGGLVGGALGTVQTANMLSGAFGGPTIGSSLGLTGPGGFLSNLGSTVLIGGGTTGAGPLLLGASGGLTTAGLASSGVVGGAALSGGGIAGGAIGGTAGSFAGGSTLAAGGGGGLLTGGAGSAALGSGLTVGTAAGAGLVGIGTGFALSQFNKLIGLNDLLGSRGSSALAGAGGGAAAGAIAGSVIPGIGTAIGAAIGTLVGALFGGLFGGSKKPPVPQFTIGGATGPGLAFTPGIGITVPETVPFVGTGRNLGKAQPLIEEGINDTSRQLLGGLQTTLRQFPEVLQEKALPVLQGMSNAFANTFNAVQFKGKDIQKQVENYLNETLPNTFKNIFEPFVKTVERAAAMLKQYDDAIVALTQRQAQVLEGIRGARQTITEALFTPAQLFETRRDTLDELLTQFRTGSNETRAQLAPQITGLTQEVFRLGTAQEVLGDDRGALEALQQEMLGILTETEMGARSAYDAALQVTREQRDILLNTFTVETEQVNLLNQMNAHLSNMVAFLQPIGSFQSSPGEFHRIGATGLGMVHAGEIIGRPTSNSFNSDINVTINVPQGSHPQQIADATASAIRRTQRQLQVRDRYRQRGTL